MNKYGKITFKEAERKCKAMWNRLAEIGGSKGVGHNTLKNKIVRELFPKDYYQGVLNDCYACHYAENLKRENNYIRDMCYFCPITWGTEEREGVKTYFCEESGSPYVGWWTCLQRLTDSECTEDEIKALAKKIADLPWTDKGGAQ